MQLSQTIDDFLSKDQNDEEMRQITFSLRAKCLGAKFCQINNKIEVSMPITGLPSNETQAAHIQIGDEKHEKHLFVWSDGASVNIRLKFTVFKIPVTYVRTLKDLPFKIEEKEGRQELVYGEEYNRTAEYKTDQLNDILLKKDELWSLVKAGTNNISLQSALQKMGQISDVLLEETKRGVNNTYEEVS